MKVLPPDPIICHHLTDSLCYRCLHIGRKSCNSLAEPRDSLHLLFHLFNTHCHGCKLQCCWGTEGHEFHYVNISRFCLTCHAWPVGWQGFFSSDTITCILLCIFARWPLTLCQTHLPFDQFCFQSCWFLATLLTRLAWWECQFTH